MAFSRSIVPLAQLFVDPHQRCGYSDSPFARKDTFLYCRIWKWVGGGAHGVSGDTKNTLTLTKKQLFVIEKYIEDAKQGQKLTPDLVESIMRPTDPAKEDLRRNLYKRSQFSPK